MKRKKLSYTEHLCQQCDNLRYALYDEGRDAADNSTDRCYKEIVLAVLSGLLFKVDAIFKLVSILLGAFIAHLLNSIIEIL